MDLAVDLSAAGGSDALDDTVDYGAVCDTLARVGRRGPPPAARAAGGLLADAVLALDPRIGEVQLAVRKLRPPVPHALSSSGVRVTRGRTP